jgi:hypothetical protein
MFQIKFSKTIFSVLVFVLTIGVFAQTSRKSTKKKPPVRKAASTAAQTPIVDGETTPDATIKKNARPAEIVNEPISTEKNGETIKTNLRPTPVALKDAPVYFYEFSQPSFQISKINIEHDESGKGRITFVKKDFSEPETIAIELSATTLERAKGIWNALNFLDSTENYQFEKDFSHLGTVKFTMKKDGRAREATFNWTGNKDAKALADEYRKIGQQFVWVFDVGVARVNQPLDTPRLLDALDSLVRRKEVSDAEQMIPLLNDLGNDERIPLIARNHATKLIKQIEKNADKK